MIKNKEEVKLCPSCKKNPSSEPHTCPYAEELENDDKTLCTCCPDCTEECALDL